MSYILKWRECLPPIQLVFSSKSKSPKPISFDRPDLACSVIKLSHYTSNSSKEHWKVLVRVLRYLKYTLNYGLHYSRYPKVLEGYCEANRISDTKDSVTPRFSKDSVWFCGVRFGLEHGLGLLKLGSDNFGPDDFRLNLLGVLYLEKEK
ncbi:hypothetical protein CASFOL_014475 [Castilleja foliolosa]|uniref:Retrovirus-related Pol polyprotein from transposon TNT 1-94 n=1 Tax=Castilleja foliolosa TaxID=1961234 RepID=A0ABD3DS40_9LAMI